MSCVVKYQRRKLRTASEKAVGVGARLNLVAVYEELRGETLTWASDDIQCNCKKTHTNAKDKHVSLGDDNAAHLSLERTSMGNPQALESNARIG